MGFCCIVSPASVHESFRWKAHEMRKILGLSLRRSSGGLALSCWGGLVARGEERNVRCIQWHMDGDAIREIRSEQSYLAWLSYNGLG